MIDRTTQPVLCVGSALWDVIAQAHNNMKPGYDVAGTITRRPGGVALNIAMALAKRGVHAALLTAIGKDSDGDMLIHELEKHGVNCDYVTRVDDPTDCYMAIESTNGEVFGAVADCAVLEKTGETIMAPLRDGRLSSLDKPWDGSVIIDGNLPIPVIESLAINKDVSNADLSFVPASPGKANRMHSLLKTQKGTLFVNKIEAEILCSSMFSDSISASKALCEIGAQRAVVTDGPNKVAVSTKDYTVDIQPPKTKSHSTTGAGDVFLASFVAAEQTKNPDLSMVMQSAANAAAEHISKER